MENVEQTLGKEEKVASEVSKFDVSDVNELPVKHEDGVFDCLQTDQHAEEIVTKISSELVDGVANEIRNELHEEHCENKIEENAIETDNSTITTSLSPQVTQNLDVSTWRSSMGDIREEKSDCGSDITDSEEGSFTESEDELLETGGVLSGSGSVGPGRRCIVVGGKLIQLPPNITVKRLTQAEGSKSVIERRREAHLDCITEEGSFKGSPSKRKHNERMTLKEVNAADFSDTKDYVDYIQSKLANVQIKIVK